MLQNTRLNASTKRKQFYSPGAKKSACPAFLLKNQIRRSQQNQSLRPADFNRYVQGNVRKSHQLSPRYLAQQQKQSSRSSDTILMSCRFASCRKNSSKPSREGSENQELERTNYENIQDNHKSEQENIEQETVAINVHTVPIIKVSASFSSNSVDATSNANLNKSNGQTAYNNIKKLFQSTLSLTKSQENSPRTSLRADDEKQQLGVQFGHFQIIKDLGKGKTSKVFLVRHKFTGLLLALKVIQKQLINQQNIEEYIFREIKILSCIKHQNIISLYKCFSDGENIYLAMQYMGSAGNLYQRWKKEKNFSEKETQKIVADICRAVSYLHRHDIIHRDIKLQNIIVMKGVAKLADLGCAVHSVYMRKSHVGSPTYLSPQQLNNNFYNKKIDVWSVGVITYELLFGYSPFDEEIGAKLQNHQRKLSFNLSFPNKPEVSETAKDFMSKLLTKNPNDRYSIQNAMQHAFISDYVKIVNK